MTNIVLSAEKVKKIKYGSSGHNTTDVYVDLKNGHRVLLSREFLKMLENLKKEKENAVSG